MDYLIKSSALLAVFYLCYQLCLRRETFFETNRWFLLSGLVMAISIPLIVIPHYIEYSVVETSGFTVNSVVANNIPIAIKEQSFDYLQLLFWTYSLGIVFFLGKLLLEFLSLYNILNTATLTSKGKFKLLETTEIVAPFSFFSTIVYNPNQFETQELAHVINHEKVHVQQYHSFDTIIAQLTCVLFWFNPFVWLYKKALQQNLEFIADQKAQYISDCSKSYQTVLLKASVTNHHLAITNNFYTSLIKKRIVMLHKSKSNPLNRLKLFVILPILALFMMSYNVKTIYIETPLDDTNIFDMPTQQTETIEILITKDTSDDALEDIKTILKDKGITFTYTGLKRNSKGEITAISTAFKSEEHSSNYNISGDDGIKSFHFKSDGESFSVGTLNNGNNSFIYRTDDGKTKVLTSGNGSNVYVLEEDDEDNEQTESVKLKVKNTQGNDKVFIKTANSGSTWISNDGTTTKINASENGTTNVWISESDEPLFVMDGKIVKKSLFEDVDSDQIQSINVLKGKTALESFGDKGKNGVILISTKGSNSLFDKNDTTTTYQFIDTNGESPIFIVDETIITEGQFRGLKPSEIDKIEVIKNENAVKVYGDKAKNGAIIVTSKNGDTKIIQGHQVIEGKPLIIEIEEESPMKIKTAVSSVNFIDDNATESIEFIVSKNATDAFLDKQKRELKAKGIDAKFSKVRRNKAGEITSIKISLDDNQGRKSSASWKEKEQAIPDIVLGKSGDKLFVRAIGN